MKDLARGRVFVVGGVPGAAVVVRLRGHLRIEARQPGAWRSIEAEVNACLVRGLSLVVSVTEVALIVRLLEHLLGEAHRRGARHRKQVP